MFYHLILLLYAALLWQNNFPEVSTRRTTTSKHISKRFIPQVVSPVSKCYFDEELDEFMEECPENQTCFVETDIATVFDDACTESNLVKLEKIIENKACFEELDVGIVECLTWLPNEIPVADYTNYIRVLSYIGDDLLFTPRRVILSELLSRVRNENSAFTLVDVGLIFKAWRPFVDNVTGIIAYRNLTYSNLLDGRSPPEMDNDTDVTISLPVNFLNKLVEDDVVANRAKLRVIILLIRDEKMSQSYFEENFKQVLGVDFPGVAVNNELTMFEIRYRSNVGVVEMDCNMNDFDPTGCAVFTRLFPQMFFLNLNEAKAEGNFCPSFTSHANFSTITWSTTPSLTLMFPTTFCMSETCAMPRKFCNVHNIPADITSSNADCYPDHFISERTPQLYGQLKCCLSNSEYCDVDLSIDAVKSYVDVKMLMIHLNYWMNNMEGLNETVWERPYLLLDKGLEFVKKENRGVSYLSCILNGLLDIVPFAKYHRRLVIKRKNFFYLTLDVDNENHPMGFILHIPDDHREFADYNVKYLSYQNATDVDYSNDKTVEAAVYLSHPSKEAFEGGGRFSFRIFVLRNYDFLKDSEFTCQSNIMVVHDLSYGQKRLKLRAYLKILENENSVFRTEGYWFTISVERRESRMFCVAKSNDDICNSEKQLVIYTLQFSTESTNKILPLTDIKVESRTIEQLDVLSQLAVWMNPGTKYMFQDYFEVLHVITLIEGVLSSSAILCILLSALFLKDWWKIKFNTVQLSIALALEMVFFLMDFDDVTHVGFMIFYYGVLAQFTWMLIIGYLQYLKFIKIFGRPCLNKRRSFVLGWFVPALIIVLPGLIHSDCLKCNLCYKNHQIFNYFVIAPASLVIVMNLIIYVAVMYSIVRIDDPQTSKEIKKAKLRAALLFPFLLGISWISIFALISPWSWLSLTGSLVFYVVTPSQGFVLFVFVVILDEDTRIQWRDKFSNWLMTMTCGKLKRNSELEKV